MPCYSVDEALATVTQLRGSRFGADVLGGIREVSEEAVVAMFLAQKGAEIGARPTGVKRIRSGARRAA